MDMDKQKVGDECQGVNCAKCDKCEKCDRYHQRGCRVYLYALVAFVLAATTFGVGLYRYCKTKAPQAPVQQAAHPGR